MAYSDHYRLSRQFQTEDERLTCICGFGLKKFKFVLLLEYHVYSFLSCGTCTQAMNVRSGETAGTNNLMVHLKPGQSKDNYSISFCDMFSLGTEVYNIFSI